MAYKVTVPVRVRRIEEVDWVFYVDTLEEAKELESYIKERGLVELNPHEEEIIEICEEDVIESYDDDVSIEEIKDDSEKSKQSS